MSETRDRLDTTSEIIKIKIPYRHLDELEKELATILKKNPRMIRLNIARLNIELKIGRRLTVIEGRKLGWAVLNSIPRNKDKDKI